jgi:hypothetical protein
MNIQGGLGRLPASRPIAEAADKALNSIDGEKYDDRDKDSGVTDLKGVEPNKVEQIAEMWIDHLFFL